LERLQKSQNDLGNDGKKLEVRVFDGVPIQSMFILDPETDSDCIMNVGPYVYGIRKEGRRIHEIDATTQNKLFDILGEL
jgi:hypothetical protein